LKQQLRNIMPKNALIQGASMTGATTMDLIAPGIWQLRLGESEPHTPVGLREIPPAWEALGRLPSADCPFRAEDIATQTAPQLFARAQAERN
jgi:hypothetical protein